MTASEFGPAPENAERPASWPWVPASCTSELKSDSLCRLCLLHRSFCPLSLPFLVSWWGLAIEYPQASHCTWRRTQSEWHSLASSRRAGAVPFYKSALVCSSYFRGAQHISLTSKGSWSYISLSNSHALNGLGCPQIWSWRDWIMYAWLLNLMLLLISIQSCWNSAERPCVPLRIWQGVTAAGVWEPWLLCEFKSWLCYLPVKWPWVDFFNPSLSVEWKLLQ